MKSRRTPDGIQDPREPEREEERPLEGMGQGRVIVGFLGVRRCSTSLERPQSLLVIIIIITLGGTEIGSAGGVLVVIIRKS